MGPLSRRLSFSLIALALLTATITLTAKAQDYPIRLVKIVVPFPPGGNPDLAARLIAQRMQVDLGQSVIVENKPGANGAIGAGTVAKSDPDGYTLMVASAGILAINPAIYEKLAYDVLKDFIPITRIAVTPLLLVSGPSSVDSIQGLIAAAKKEPGKLTYGSSGVGSSAHMAGALLGQMSGTDLLHVTFRGTADVTAAVASGTISVAFGGQGASWPLVDAGKLKALALTGANRDPNHPQVPTVAEAGVTGFNVTDWVGILAPAGTPQPVVDKLNAAIKRALADPELQQKFALQALEPAPTTQQEFTAIISSEQKKWVDVATKANIKVQP